MNDQRLIEYRNAVASMRRGLFNVDLPAGPPDDLGAFGCELSELASTLGRRFEQCRLLLRVTETVNSGVLLDDVLDCIYRSFRESIPYDRIGCALIEDGATLRAVWARMEYPECQIYKGYNLSLGETSLEPILATREPRIINDLEEHRVSRLTSESSARMLQEGIRSSLTCPLVADGKPVGFLFFSSRKPGTYRDLHTHIFKELAGQLSYIIQKARLYEQLLQTNNEKNRFLGTAAHDLRNPLSAIYGLLQVLRGDPEMRPGERSELVGLMIDACEGMIPMIDDLLDISAIAEGTVRMEFVEAPLRPFLEKAVAINAAIARPKNTEIRLECAGGLPETVRWDPHRVTQILNNFISNAVKFSPPRSLVRVQVAPAPGGAVQVRVIDQGPGIAPEEQGKLFQPYARASVRPTAGEKSTGLGLAITRRMVTAHGGTTGLESKVGSGSTFWFTLPVEPAPQKESAAAPAEPANPAQA
jgi:hypothetical protein